MRIESPALVAYAFNGVFFDDQADLENFMNWMWVGLIAQVWNVT